MLYSNQNLESIAKVVDFETVYEIQCGQRGYKRKLMTLACPKGTRVRRGLNADLTICINKSGNAVISKEVNKNLFLLLSAQDEIGCIDSTIQVVAKQQQKFTVMARGNGLHDCIEKSCYWSCALIQAPRNNAIIRVGNSDSSALYLIHRGTVHCCSISEIEEYCNGFKIPLPCKVLHDDHLHFGDDWVTL